jgi:hypothetical protein
MAGFHISEPNAQFTYDFPLPPEAASGERLEVVLEVERTMKEEDRELGLAFGTFALR